MNQVQHQFEATSANSIGASADAHIETAKTRDAAAPSGRLHELFEAQADARGDAVALACGDLNLSYGELEARANQLAHHLRAAGAGPGELIGLCLNRSELPIIAILGCLKAGAAYAPIDPTHPDERIRYIVDEAGISL